MAGPEPALAENEDNRFLLVSIGSSRTTALCEECYHKLSTVLVDRASWFESLTGSEKQANLGAGRKHCGFPKLKWEAIAFPKRTSAEAKPVSRLGPSPSTGGASLVGPTLQKWNDMPPAIVLDE